MTRRDHHVRHGAAASVGVVALVVLAILGLHLGDGLQRGGDQAHAATPDAASLGVRIHRDGDRATLDVRGQVPADVNGQVAVRLLRLDDASDRCAASPSVRRTTRVVAWTGATATAWTPAPGTATPAPLRAGARFAIPAAVALPAGSARLCAYLVHGGRRAGVLRSASVVAPNASGAMPMKVRFEPVLRHATVGTAVFLLVLVLLGTVGHAALVTRRGRRLRARPLP